MTILSHLFARGQRWSSERLCHVANAREERKCLLKFDEYCNSPDRKLFTWRPFLSTGIAVFHYDPKSRFFDRHFSRCRPNWMESVVARSLMGSIDPDRSMQAKRKDSVFCNT